MANSLQTYGECESQKNLILMCKRLGDWEGGGGGGLRLFVTAVKPDVSEPSILMSALKNFLKKSVKVGGECQW